MRAVPAVLALLLALHGCGEDDVAPGPVLTVELVTPAGEDPLVGAESVRLRVRQGEGELVEREVAVEGGAFRADLPLADLVTPVHVAVEVVGDGGVTIGAPPPFVPAESLGLVRIPVGVPGSCAVVAGMDLGHGRSDVAVARHRTFALVAGGVAAEGPSAAAGFLDLLHLDDGAFEDLAQPAGAARAARFSAAQSIVVAAARSPFRYDVESEAMPELEGGLHPGAGPASAVVALGPRGAAVLGGADGGSPVADVTWIAPDGSTTASRLVAPRAGAAAVQLGARVLVVGGTDGEPWAELLPIGHDGGAVDAPAEEPREDAVLLADAAGERALLLGGVGSTGAPRTDTVLLTCAPDCVAEPGPEWSRARGGVAVVPLPGGGGLLAGGEGPVASVDRVTFEPDTVLVEPTGDLEAARGGAAGLSIEAGLAFVVGGRGSAGPRADVEVCFPRSLSSF